MHLNLSFDVLAIIGFMVSLKRVRKGSKEQSVLLLREEINKIKSEQCND